MFCGIGTVRMGFEQAGHECVYSIERDKHKRGIYNVIFGSEPEGGDISECRGQDLPRSDCWVFGAPCQDFSLSGTRAGLGGDRSSLVREVFRLVREIKKEYRPKWLLYENVGGMLSSNKGLDYFQILVEMESLGYDIEWQMLNSKDFGVPHNRERVFTLGHLRGRGGRKIFPFRENAKTINNTNSPSRVLVKEATKKGYAEAHEGDSINLEHPNSKTRRGRVGHQQANTLTTSCNQAVVLPCIAASRGRNPKNPSDRTAGNHVEQRLEINKTGNSNTITTVQKDNYVLTPQYRIRKLTPKETWRLQGIKDEITNKVIAAGTSDAQMYRGAGDACTVNVIYEIAKRLN